MVVFVVVRFGFVAMSEWRLREWYCRFRVLDESADVVAERVTEGQVEGEGLGSCGEGLGPACGVSSWADEDG